MAQKRIEQKVAELAPRLDVMTGSLNSEDVEKGLALLEEVDKYLALSIYVDKYSADKTNIVVLGTSGAGKSTVVSFLFGEGPIVVHHESRFSRVLVATSPLPGVSINSGAVSTTLLPAVNHVKLQDEPVVVWDMPGSRDTRGPFVQLVVHFIYRWMLKDDKNLKFIIVSPPPLERPQIVALEKMINGSLVRQDNAIVVYTKCSRDFDPGSTSDLNVNESKRGIGSFKLRDPANSDDEGHNYSSEYSDRKTTILHALRGLQPSQVEFDEILPDSAKLLLNSMTKTCIERVQETLSACFIRLYNWDSYRATYEDICTTLEMLKSANPLCVQEMIDLLAHLVPTISDALQKEEAFLLARRRLSLVETLNGKEPQRRHLIEWLNAKGIQVLEEAKEKLLELRNAVKSYRSVTTEDDDLEIAAFHLRLSNEKETIEKFVAKREKDPVCGIDGRWAYDVPEVYLVGLHSIDIDTDLQLWVCITLVSPSIQVTAECGFDLSARGQAKSVPEQNKPGVDGLNGSKGYPGGSLMAVSLQLKDDQNLIRNTKSQGQKGGDAQNGGDGVNGKDSTYNEDTFRDDIQCSIDNGLLQEEAGNVPRDLPNGLQLVKFKTEDSPLHGPVLGIPGKKTVKVKKTSEAGEKRIPAGNGGHGGFGGPRGEIFVKTGQTVWEGGGMAGLDGQDGSPGKASRDGYSSPNFTATIRQWYNKAGWIRVNDEADPEIDVRVEEVKLEDQPQFVQGCTVSVAKHEMRHWFDTSFVETIYREDRYQIEAKFPQCDFTGLNATLENEDECLS